MKTTLDLPDELMRIVKVRAARESRKLKEVVADLIKRGLAAKPEGPRTNSKRVQLPLVRCAHEARANEEMTPNRIARVLFEEEAERGPGEPRS